MPKKPKTIGEIFNSQAKYQDSMLAWFTDELTSIVVKAQAETLKKTQSKLKKTPDGKIKPGTVTAKTIQDVGQTFLKEMDAAGYQDIVASFVKEFDGLLPMVNEVIDYLRQNVKEDWPEIEFTATDLDAMAGVQSVTATSLQQAVKDAASGAVRQSLFSIGGLDFGTLVDVLKSALMTSVGKARTIAETGMSTFYRTATDRAFQQIEHEVPAQEIRYKYSGPDDKLTRPFCEHLLDTDKPHSREEIDKMDNGQFGKGSVFLTGGGWNCRHQWIIDVDFLLANATEAA